MMKESMVGLGLALGWLVVGVIGIAIGDFYLFVLMMIVATIVVVRMFTEFRRREHFKNQTNQIEVHAYKSTGEMEMYANQMKEAGYTIDQTQTVVPRKGCLWLITFGFLRGRKPEMVVTYQR